MMLLKISMLQLLGNCHPLLLMGCNMTKTKNVPPNVPPEKLIIVNKLNDIHDELRKIQCATGFLAIASNSFDEKYSQDVTWGARLCFDMLDKHIEEVLGHIEKLTSEVQLHESHT